MQRVAQPLLPGVLGVSPSFLSAGGGAVSRQRRAAKLASIYQLSPAELAFEGFDEVLAGVQLLLQIAQSHHVVTLEAHAFDALKHG